jgi:glycosyltransferase involved in cell wall biosynthesis
MRIFVPSAAAVLTDTGLHGEGQIAWQVLSGLAARGHKVVACAPTVQLERTPPFRVLELGRPRLESLHPYVYAARARRALHEHGPFDVVHWLYPGESDQVLFTPPNGTPFVVGPMFAPWRTGRGRPFRAGDVARAALSPAERLLHRRALRAATVLLATPDARERGRVVSPGVDVSRFTPEPPTGETIAFVGRLERSKGVRELVRAFARVVEQRPEARLVVAGDGGERDWLERNASPQTSLLGGVPPEAVPGVLSRAALVCLPSHGEPYGMTVVEAMAAGRAVVATDAGGPRFLVPPGGGRLVPVGDADALATALVELLAEPATLAAMGRRNREHVERELSLERMLDQLESVYTELAG